MAALLLGPSLPSHLLPLLLLLISLFTFSLEKHAGSWERAGGDNPASSRGFCQKARLALCIREERAPAQGLQEEEDKGALLFQCIRGACQNRGNGSQEGLPGSHWKLTLCLETYRPLPEPSTKEKQNTVRHGSPVKYFHWTCERCLLNQCNCGSFVYYIKPMKNSGIQQRTNVLSPKSSFVPPLWGVKTRYKRRGELKGQRAVKKKQGDRSLCSRIIQVKLPHMNASTRACLSQLGSSPSGCLIHRKTRDIILQHYKSSLICWTDCFVAPSNMKESGKFFKKLICGETGDSCPQLSHSRRSSKHKRNWSHCSANVDYKIVFLLPCANYSTRESPRTGEKADSDEAKDGLAALGRLFPTAFLMCNISRSFQSAEVYNQWELCTGAALYQCVSQCHLSAEKGGMDSVRSRNLICDCLILSDITFQKKEAGTWDLLQGVKLCVMKFVKQHRKKHLNPREADYTDGRQTEVRGECPTLPEKLCPLQTHASEKPFSFVSRQLSCSRSWCDHLPLDECLTLISCLEQCLLRLLRKETFCHCLIAGFSQCWESDPNQCCNFSRKVCGRIRANSSFERHEEDDLPVPAPSQETAPRAEPEAAPAPTEGSSDAQPQPTTLCEGLRLFFRPCNSTKGSLKTNFAAMKPGSPLLIDLFAHLQLKPSKAMHFHQFLSKSPISTAGVKQRGRSRRQERASLALVRTPRAANRHPQFPQHNYQVQVAENQPPGTPVITLTAQDQDSGEAGRLFYAMDALMNSRSLELFNIDSVTGLISTVEILDRENMDLHYFRVTAMDHGTPRLSATTMISITVADRNDHNPVFEQAEYRETIRENVEEGYPILQLRATDGDSPANANIRYRFLHEQAAHSVFEIDPRSGLITTSGQVDREKMEKYSLIVEANDQGKEPAPRSATVKVYITVLDENDNVPQFSEKRYIVQVREDIRPHREILRVTATDMDKDNNALVHYNIISGNSRGQFAIDSVTGEIQVVAPLDFEVEREYSLRIRAQDAGRPPLSNNTGMVSIQVMDINDHTPIFVSTPFQVSVLENAAVGHSVIHIQAVDADYGENSRMEYKLTGVSPDTPFVINSATGWITVSGSLDRETVENYFFGVEARDHGTPPLSASASVTITVMDVNDNRPEFTQKEYFIRLNEDATVGTNVLSVTAIDRDVNSAISYQITGGNTRSRFAISTQGGVGLITLSLPLDYKQERRYVLTVTATDRTLHDNCYVHINITDANTHKPVFQSTQYSVNINEDSPIGSTVVVINAADEDVGENARITYFLEDNIPQFRINADNGAITLHAELDYEDQMAYTLAITAKDNGIPQKSDTTYVEIMVNDVNDNAPQFVNAHYQGIVSEDAVPFTSVLQISATDRDAHANGRVQYTFQNGEDGDGDFTIEPTSGIIRTVRGLDRESVPVYELTAYAVDRGTPPQRSPVRIQVTVQDVNDNAPVFPADEFEVFVKENSIVGSVVARITATDPDEGSNAQIMYQIVEGNIPEIFQMDIFSGELTALIDLDYETKAEYVIVVQATSAPLVSRATIHIKLIDQNDNSPVLKNFQILFNNYISNRSNSFPSGIIGKIPAYDPDVSDRLFYTFERGNELNLLIVDQSSGELKLSRKLDNNRPLIASMLVTVTDGIHSVTFLVVLRVIIITEEMLENSITVRLENMSQERFLSPLLTSFLDGVATVLAVSKEDIFIFNIQNDMDVGGTILNVSFSALVPSGRRGQFFSSEDLQEQLYMKRMALTSVSMLEVLPFDDNVCLREPCENYMKCISVLRFDSSAPFIASESILFRPIHPITGLRCRCPQGFTGDYCETEVNLCYSNPCQNEGVCTRREGGYTCVCREHFTGDNCEVDSGAGRCVPGVCRNGGTCTNLASGGFQCQCPSGGFEKPYCELSIRSFPPNSFVMFRGLRQRFRMSLSLSFATLERNGLLFYNGRLNEKHDFIAVEIIDGQVQLKYSTGESTTLVTPYLPGGVSDGEWHTLQLQYYNKPRTGSMGVAQGPSKEKVAVLALDDCDMSVALQFGSRIGNYSCAAEGVQSSSKKSLDLTGPLLLGGVPNLPENFPVAHKEFVGCMRNLYIDSKRIDLASYIANNGTSAGCHAKHSFCDSNPCKNGGSCLVTWGSFTCECPLGFGGKDCRHAMHHPYHFLGNSIVSWDFKNELKISIPWFLGFAFRTRKSEGILLQAHAGQYTTILCQVVSGLLSFSVSRGSSRSTKLLLDQMLVNDGKWHDLQLELRDVHSGRETRYVITISLDFGTYQDTVVVGNELHGLKMKHLHVGGTLGSGKVQNGLEGCIQGLRLGETLTGIVLPKPSNTQNAEAGCSLANACASSPCPPNSSCRDHWQSYSCVCQPGHYGESCADVCQLNPCKNKSVCRRKPSSPRGYVCQCGENHFGQYCEHRRDQQCPKGWWGNQTCGPCNCDVNKGFDPDCNKTTGQCRCKDFHYCPKGSDSCLPCDCYPIGSSSRSCEQETGQCPCRPGVIGRQCNGCDNPFAEVTPNGCEVIYDGCPKALRAGVWWPRIKFGLPAAVPCPKGSLGAAFRHCDEEKGWLEPDLFNCTSPPFTELSALLESLEKNETELNTIEAKKLAYRLSSVTDQMDRYFGNDVQITYRLLLRLMEFESKQRGFGLTATQDAHFTENLLRAGSSVLALENKEHWEMLPQSENGSAGLMEQLREYTSTLAKNMKLTYLNPIGLVTPNIILSIDRMENHTHSRRHFPRYHSNLFRGQATWDPHTHVELPVSVLLSPRVQAPSTAAPTLTSIELNATAEVSTPKKIIPEPEPAVTILILIIYRTLGGLLPARYSTDRRSIRLPKNPVMNSPIVSVSVFRNHTFIQGILDSPLTLEFRLLETANRSKPLCVQWNYSSLADAPGSWTARDCDLVYRNATHVRCHCSHLGTFGVLMDSSHREQLEGDLETLAIVTYSCLSVSLAALLITFLILACLKGLKSNTRGIHINIAVALFLSELVFLLGINRTENQFLCTVIAILLHYFFLSTFAWLFVEGLHIYRMHTEVRNVNVGAMRFYYGIGWGVPAIVTGLAVGLDPEGYGNPDFCWISVHEKLVGSFAGPIAVVIVMNGVMFLMLAKMLCSPGQKEAKKKSILMTLRSSFVLLLFISTTWLFGLLAVNNSVLVFHYLYTILCSLQGLAVLFLFCVFNEEVQGAWKLVCLGKKSQSEETARPAQGPNSYNNTSLFEESGLIRITLGASTISSVSSVRSARTHSSKRGFLRDNMAARQGSTVDHSLLGHAGPTDLDVAMFHRDAGGGQDSDSDSDLSLDEERSLSIPSSESEENVRIRGRFQRQFKRAAHSERLLTNPVNSSPKDVDGNDLMSYWPALGECEVHPCSLQKWGSERKLGLDLNKDAANNNQPELSLTSGDENSLTQSHRQRKGILKNRLQYPPALQGLSSVGRMTNELSWYKTSTLGHRAVPAASYGRMYSGAGSLSQPASRYSSREQLDMLMRRQMSKEQLSRNNSRELLEVTSSRHGSKEHLDTIPNRHGSRDQLDTILSRHGSREHLESIPSRHGSRDNLDMSRARNDQRDHLNSLTRRQGSKEHLDTIPSRFGSREQIDYGPVREVSKEWLNTLPTRQVSRDRMDTLPSRQTSREHLDLLSKRQPSRDQLASARQTSREQLDILSRRSNSREHLNTVPSTHPSRENLELLSQRQPSRENLEPLSGRLPSRDNLEPLSRRQPSRENLEAISSRHPSTEQLDILSSILASFNSSALSNVQSSTSHSAPHNTTTPSAVQNSSTPSALCPSTPHSATSHSIAELSPDSEIVRSEGHS
ncbi:LOW QUALITY PROTEIN: cadherin EGF LAG seven-pass G-type receptor 3 [Rhinatrema bivittatum]|uniref:LOW QUALITY PROTEIN: cadherin EGF LAG seven-pass G-type receptor 3 n=1 Tax=Rhinatrema bivittatum TaxID=194408 RepID=UPI001129DBDA|nr:LOW QUALITY PROTEIN: cadherin EGF LAG seven-pass G-type receptor 3 [Rhinatrema bivittatum]